MSDKLLSAIGPQGIATLTLNRPAIHNAFDDELVSLLSEQLIALDANPTVRAVIVSGRGRSFSAGADLNWMQSMVNASRDENIQDSLRLATLMRTLNYLSKPTIARINGAAFGGGVGLAACCDIAIAADTAQFGLTEVRLGLAPAVISPYVFRKIGEQAARRYFVTGEVFSAEKAVRLGLIHETVPAERLDEAVQRQVALILQAGPEAVRYCKQLTFAVAGHDATQQQQLDQQTAAMIAELRISGEGQEGLRSFLDKRAPQWATKAGRNRE